MKKRYFKYGFILTFLFFIGFCPFLICKVYAEEIIEDKVLCDATIDEDFEDNDILVVLTKEASKDFRIYTTLDFNEIKCKSVEDLTSSYKELIEKGKYHNDNYRRILYIQLFIHDKNNVIKSIQKIQNRNEIYCAYPNYIEEVCSVEPNDFLNDEQEYLSTIKVDTVWEIETGNSTVKVGVIDTGIDGNHEDLKNRVDRKLSKSFSTVYTNPLEDVHGHGTHVAGIIGAEANNSVGVAGVCWDVDLVSLRVVNEEGKLKLKWIIDAIDYATQQNIPILNLSGGEYKYYSEFINAINNYPGLFVCSAGNDGLDTDLNQHYPSGYDLDNIISVGASNSENNAASFSNRGKTSIDVFAPGVNIMSTYPTQLFSDGYRALNGTSMAAPIVTGVAALLLSNNPDLTPSEIKNAIIETVDKYNTLNELCVSGGIINAYEAFVLTHRHKYTYTYVDKVYHNGECMVCSNSCVEMHHWESNGPYGIHTGEAMPYYIPKYTCYRCNGIILGPLPSEFL